MARANAEQQQPATGMTLIVLVGLAIAFLLFMAFLNVVKSGNLLNETNLLFATLIFYAGAGALYLGFGVTGTRVVREVRLALPPGSDCSPIPPPLPIAGMNPDMRRFPASTKCCSASCGRWPCSRWSPKKNMA